MIPPQAPAQGNVQRQCTAQLHKTPNKCISVALGYLARERKMLHSTYDQYILFLYSALHKKGSQDTEQLRAIATTTLPHQHESIGSIHPAVTICHSFQSVIHGKATALCHKSNPSRPINQCKWAVVKYRLTVGVDSSLSPLWPGFDFQSGIVFSHSQNALRVLWHNSGTGKGSKKGKRIDSMY